MIKAESIRNMIHVKQILDYLQEYIRSHKMQMGDLSEDTWTNIRFQLCEIDEFIIGFQNSDEHNYLAADLRIMSYFEYLNDECNFDELIYKLRQYEGEV